MADHKKKASTYTPESDFNPENHYYTKVLNAQLHPLVKYFMSLNLEQIVARYVHMKPTVRPEFLKALLTRKPHSFRWGGADLFYTTDLKGTRSMIIVETNSCPSGQKSFPYVEDSEVRNGYYELLKKTFIPAMKLAAEAGTLPEGGLAVLYDKNPVETHGYAITLAQLAKETVYCVKCSQNDSDPPFRWTENGTILQVRDENGTWHPIRAAFRYVTQKPWNRLPVPSANKVRTFILNPTSVCLAGGRNKLMADKAYEFFNLRHSGDHVQIKTPSTIRDLYKNEIPLYIKAWGGIGVVKVPYSNAGQGVYCILNQRDLEEFMNEETNYDQFIVQQLVGNAGWSSRVQENAYYHLGLVPDSKNRIFCADLRMMLCFDYKRNSYRPLALYARRAASPLLDNLEGKSYNSWEMLGTNLSVKLEDGSWTTDTSRLMIMDHRDFNRLGLSLDDLIEGFFQTVFAMSAIDHLSRNLENSPNGAWDMSLFQSLNNDQTLIAEIAVEGQEQTKKEEKVAN
jgi:hypothetical protein